MTITQERPRPLISFRAVAVPPEIPECTGSRHAPSRHSWAKGCRCPSTVAAHDRWLGDRARRVEPRHPPAVTEDGACLADRHGTQYAYIRFGCRCPEAEAAQERKMAYDRVKAVHYSAEAKRVRRQTGGRLKSDPRTPWRGPLMRVDRNSLMLLLGGFADSPTKGERIAAVAILGRRGSMALGLNDARRISERLGVHVREVTRFRADVRMLRDRRAARRLADAQWRAAVTAAGVGRKQQRGAEYAAAVQRAQLRREHYEAVRTIRQERIERRLRESRERAKLVTLAIERRARRG